MAHEMEKEELEQIKHSLICSDYYSVPNDVALRMLTEIGRLQRLADGRDREIHRLREKNS